LDDTIQSGAQPVVSHQRYGVRFTGTTGEYFRIWIVNLALTILTLGIYSAWAKVRKRRYFYGNTLIDDAPFEYRADPIGILRGRIIAVALFAVYYVISHFYPLFIFPFLIVLAIAVPWLVCKSRAFNAHNSAYRNIRFAFTGRYGEAFKIIIGIALLIPFSLGLIYPYYKMRQLNFIIGHHRYGNTQFEWRAGVGAFFKIYLAALALLVGLFFLFGLVAALTKGFGVFATGAPGGAARAAGQLRFMLMLLPVYGIYLFVFVYVHARITNTAWNNLRVGPVRFECRLRAGELFVLFLTNILAILLTLGLATPWASIRTAQYRAARMTLRSAQPLASFAAEVGHDVSATGQEVSEVFDIDIGL
jgi:uncharacterized membrane protein YjgN (DUF898 family)